MPKKAKKKVSILDKKWNSLSSLKGYFEREGDEKVVSFNGIELVTGKYKYTLAYGKLHREKK